MSSFISQQPNGRYCRFSSVVDGVTHVNMTYEDYVDLLVENGRNRESAIETANEIMDRRLRPFIEVLEGMSTSNATVGQLIMEIRLMGYEGDLTSYIKGWKEEINFD
ncbi:hypothetical protein PI27_gp063 [Listeria phage WIL-1]|uniref:hypothetical protein n=1 Tax=Listeria phage WIL-1 TaxID=1541821 RepID=UPI00248AEA5D|nr:hypothetical protein PI27_gp063 [Listeria phage WIL-1]